MALRSFSNLTWVGSNATANVPVPAGAAIDDIAQIWLWVGITTTPINVVPSGFVLKTGPLSIGGAQSGVIYHYWKRLTSADSGTWNFSLGNTTSRAAWATLHSGRITTGDPFDYSLGYVTPSGTQTRPGILTGTTTVAGCDLTYAVDAWSGVTNLSTTDTPSWIKQFGTADGENLWTKDNQGVGEPGATQVNTTTATTWWAVLSAVKPAIVVVANTSNFFAFLRE